MLKNAKRSFKRTSVKSDNSDCEAFYLKQSERATTAKNQLLYLTSVNEKFYSTGAINYRQKCPKLHQSYDSWHNQSLDLQEYTPKKIQKSAQNLKASIANIEELETPRVSYSRHLIQSADCTIFKKKRSSIRNPANKPQSSIIEINSNNLNTINFCKSLNSSHQQLRASSNIMKRKIKTLSAHPDNRHASLKNYNNQSKNSLIFDFGLPRDGKVGSTGVLLSSFKRKNNKKGNWLHRSSKISSNMCRIEQFKTSNSPLKREIDKILRLLNEQSTYGKASPYE